MRDSRIKEDGKGARLKELFPEAELEGCTKAEAESFCRKYAETAGYKDAQLSIYAMTFDSIVALDENKFGAPDPLYEPPNTEGFWELSKEQVDAIDNGDYARVNELQEQLDKMQEGVYHYTEWQKKDEAYLLIYRPVINGLVVDGASQMLIMVYLPAEKRIVYASGELPLGFVSAEKEEPLITAEQAVSELLISRGITDQKKIEILSAELVYSTKAVLMAEKDKIIRPCWKIDYTMDNMGFNDSGSIHIDAISGMVSYYVDGA